MKNIPWQDEVAALLAMKLRVHGLGIGFYRQNGRWRVVAASAEPAMIYIRWNTSVQTLEAFHGIKLSQSTGEKNVN